MSIRSKSTLFLIEQLIVTAVFAICATACIRIVTNAYFFAVDTRDVSNALLAAESGADSFKAVYGDFGKAATLLGGFVDNRDGAAVLVVYYDERWQVSGEDAANYVLFLTHEQSEPLSSLLFTGRLSVGKVAGGELVSIPVAVIHSD